MANTRICFREAAVEDKGWSKFSTNMADSREQNFMNLPLVRLYIASGGWIMEEGCIENYLE
jgi:hypothetical protein